jgi:hypothetical protein
VVVAHAARNYLSQAKAANRGNAYT